jgi:integrase
LTWNKVDLNAGIVRLEHGETKNNEDRTVYLDEELIAIFRDQWVKQKKHGRLCPYVFPNREGTGRIAEFRFTWNCTCREAGLGYGYRLNNEYVAK